MFAQGDPLPPPSLSQPVYISCHILSVSMYTHAPQLQPTLSSSPESNIPPIGNTCGSLTKAGMFSAPCMSAVSQSLCCLFWMPSSPLQGYTASRLHNVCKRSVKTKHCCCGFALVFLNDIKGAVCKSWPPVELQTTLGRHITTAANCICLWLLPLLAC